MNRAELGAYLQTIGVAERSYSLHGEHKEDSFCIDQRPGGWVVYYSERGAESSIATWIAEEDACADLLARVVRNTAATRPSEVSTPAGWYADGRGGLAWWDGARWTGAVAERPVDRTWAVLAHVSLFVLAIVAPLVIMLTAGRADRYTKHHASEALNAQIWFAIVWNLMFGGLLVSAIVSSEPPVWMFALLPVGGVLFIGFAVLAIVGAVRASRGELWRYPLPFRFVRGAVPR